MVTWPLFGTLQGAAWSQTLQTSKNLQSLGFPSVPLVWGKTVSCRLCAGQSKGTLKTRKMVFLDLVPPTLQNSGIFHDSTRPHPHFDGLPPKSRRSVVSVSDLGCVTSITENIVVLVCPGAGHAPIAVYVCPQVYPIQQ